MPKQFKNIFGHVLKKWAYPIDDLWYHKQLQKYADFRVKVISAFRPDQAMFIEKNSFSEYMKKLFIVYKIMDNPQDLTIFTTIHQ